MKRCRETRSSLFFLHHKRIFRKVFRFPPLHCCAMFVIIYVPRCQSGWNETRREKHIIMLPFSIIWLSWVSRKLNLPSRKPRRNRIPPHTRNSVNFHSPTPAGMATTRIHCWKAWKRSTKVGVDAFNGSLLLKHHGFPMYSSCAMNISGMTTLGDGNEKWCRVISCCVIPEAIVAF